MQPGTVITFSENEEVEILKGGYDEKALMRRNISNPFMLKLASIPDGATEDEIKQIELENQIAEKVYNAYIEGLVSEAPASEIVPGMKVVYDEITGEINNIYYKDENDPSGYSIHNSPEIEVNKSMSRASGDQIKSWGSAPNVLTYQSVDDSFLGTGRATYFTGTTGNRDNTLQNYDVACKMGYDATKLKTRANCAITLRNLDTDSAYTVYHASVGAMDNAIIDIWGLSNLHTIAGKTGVTSISSVRYYHKRFSDQSIPTGW